MFLTHALRAILRTAVATGDALWKYVSLLLSGTPPTQTFIADASVNANVLTLNGDVRPSNLNPYIEGYYSNYFGSGNYITSPSNSALGFGTGDFTVEAWVYPNAAYTTYNYIWSNSVSGGLTFYVLGGVLYARTYFVEDLLASSTAPALNTWTHVAVTRSGTTLRIFVNGVQTGSTTNSTNFTTGGSIIGNDGTNVAPWLGYISNLRVVKGTAVYTSNFTPSTTPLTAITNTSLLTCQANRFIDNSANNFAITRNGDVAVRGFVPFTPPTTVNVNTLYSTTFDGSSYLSTATSSGLTIGTQAFTVEFWVYHTTSSTSTQYVDSATNGFSLSKNTSNQIVVAQSGVAALLTTTTALTANTWNHVAITRNASNVVTVWINGVSANTATLTTNFTNTYLVVGRQAGAATAYLSGHMSNLRQVTGTALYTANFTPSTTPLTAVSGTSLLTCQNATLRDNSTNAFAITSFGQAQPVDVSPFTQVTTPVTATYLGSGYFDGSGDYLTLPSNQAQFTMGTGDFTVELWVYITSLAATRTLYDTMNGGDGSGTGRFAIQITTGGVVQVFTGAGSVFTSGGTVLANTWTHIAYSRSSASGRLFVNGVQVNTTYTDNNNYVVGTTSRPIIGVNAYDSSSNPMLGSIADIRVVKGTALYTANFAPPATPLTAVANTSLLTLQTDQPAANKQFIDNSGSNLVITQAGNATQGAFSPYGSNWSNYFDGSSSYLTASSTVIPATQSTFTIEAWVYMTAGPNGTFIPGMCGDMLGGSNTNYMSFGPVTISGTRYVGFYWYDPSQRNCYGSTTPLSLNTWYHIAISISANAIKMFVNGVSQTITYSAGVSGLTNRGGTSSNFTIGGFNAASNSYIGYISNLRVVNGSAVYPADFTPSTTPLTPVANTALMTCQGPSLTDSSNAALALTRTGTVAVQRFSPFSPVIQTPVSYSTYFDGNGDNLSIASSTAFGFGTGDFTIEFWAYSTSTARQDWVDISDGTNRVLFYYSGSAVTFYGNGVTAITGPALTTNAWVHYALVKSSGSTKLYVNGTQAGSTYATNQNYGTTAAVSIGKDMFGSTYITGYLSNFRIVKGTGLYTSNFTPSTAPLTAVSGTSLLTCQSPTIVDNSTNAFPITVSGNAIARSQNPFGFTNTTTGTAYTPALYGGSAYFDGSGDYLSTPSLISAPGDFTLECWFNTTIAVSGFRMLCGGNIDLSASNYLGINASGVEAQFGSGSGTVVTAAYTFVPNTWYHVAMTRSGTTIRIFVNGVSLTTSQGSQAGTFAIRYIAIGYNGITFTGYMADLRFVIGQAIYTGGFVPPIAPLQAVKNTTLLLNMDKSGVTDSSRCVDLETVGDAKIRYESPYSGNYYSNYFDGSGDYLTVPANSAFAFGTGDFTVEGWIYDSGTTAAYAQICGASTYGVANEYIVAVNGSTKKVYVQLSTTGGYTSAGTYSANTWTHIAVVRNGSTVTIYANGTSIGSYTDSDSVSSTLVTSIGGSSNANADSMFIGYISNIRIVKGTAVYTAAFTPPTAPLTAISGTSLLTCQSKSFVDNSSNNFTITRNGNTAVRSMNPFQANTANSSMYFDGTGDYLVAPNSQSLFSFGTGDFTVECWANYNSLGGDQGIVDCRATGGGLTNWILNVKPSGVVDFIYGATRLQTAGLFTTGTWVHIAVTRAAGVIRIFVNGTNSASATYTQAIDSATTTPNIGRANDPAYTNGYIADLRITKSARYTANFTPPTAPLPTA